jgi:hypothetical protein
MEIKEYPEIKKNGEVIAKKTSIHELVYNFTCQMHERGYTTAVYFTDKQKVKEQAEQEEAEFLREVDEDVLEVTDEEYPTGLSWGPLFNRQDMTDFILHYLDATTQPKGKLLFATRLQNEVLGKLMDDSDEEDYYDEDQEEDY